jgi:hypothetical protein
VVLIGGIGVHKGYDILLACAEDAVRRQLPLEFTVIGHTDDDARLMATGKIFVTGRYREEEIEALLRRERPHLAWFASIVPETWCYALSHAVRAGLPVVAADFGALGERLAGAAYATFLAPDMAPSALNERFLRVIEDIEGRKSKLIGPAARTTPEARRDGTTSENKGMVEDMKQISAEATQDRLTVSVQLLNLAEGIYAFLVRSSLPAKAAVDDNLLLPAVHVARGPDTGGGEIEFMTGPRGRATWLRDSGDVVMARVTGEPVMVLLTSLRVPGAPALALEIQRVDGRSVLGPPALAAGEDDSSDSETKGDIASKIIAHVQTRGDMTFAGGAWAGLVGQRLWVESFAIEPEAPLAKGDIEYKGLTATGFETPWLTGGASCGTRGMGIPLVAFSVRIRPGAQAAPYDCEYTGRFLSGATVGPLRNGAPCRSAMPDDPLEAIRLRILERPAALAESQQATVPKPAKAAAPTEGKAARTKTESTADAPAATPKRGSPARRAAKPGTDA